MCNCLMAGVVRCCGAGVSSQSRDALLRGRGRGARHPRMRTVHIHCTLGRDSRAHGTAREHDGSGFFTRLAAASARASLASSSWLCGIVMHCASRNVQTAAPVLRFGGQRFFFVWLAIGCPWPARAAGQCMLKLAL